MTYVVTEACINCKHTDCVEVCPTDAFHAGPNFLVIHPDECIDCTACVSECPVEAIYADVDVPAAQQSFITLNAELAADWPTLARKQSPLPDAAYWATVTDKRNELKHP